MTVKQLKEIIKDAADNAVVYIEDTYNYGNVKREAEKVKAETCITIDEGAEKITQEITIVS